MGKQLTPELIIQRTKSDKFEVIKNLNLWGNDLDDVSVIKDLPNLEVLSLSVNKIATLKDFAACPKLTELYLRKNAVTDLAEVRYLSKLRQLRVLWLWDNPCSEIANYRLIVIRLLPQLTKLDNSAISNEERDAATQINVDDLLAAEPPKEAPKRRPEPVHQASSRDSDIERAPVVVREPPQAPSVQSQSQSQPPSQPRAHAPARMPVSVAPKVELEPAREPGKESKSENILCAVLALLKELDNRSLDLVKRDIERKLTGKKAYSEF